MHALSGIRVLDFSHVIAGPFASFYLAQFGAQVDKIEKPGGGDVMRRSGSGAQAFTALNAGKHCVEIDIQDAAGREAVLRMARVADVMIDNYRPGVLERHGLGYEAIRAVNPRIIYCAISGFGYSRPELAQRGAYDHIIQAMTGMAMLGGNAGDPPVKTGFPVIDAATGILGALSIVVALRERDQTGNGCFLDVSMWASALQLMYPFACNALTHGTEIPRVGNQGYSGSPAANMFACADGWIALGANTPQQIAQVLRVLGIDTEEAASLEPSAPGQASFARARDPHAFKDLLTSRLCEASAVELEQTLNACGVPAARVRTLTEFTREAVDTGLLAPTVLGEGASQVTTPGLGWRHCVAEAP